MKKPLLDRLIAHLAQAGPQSNRELREALQPGHGQLSAVLSALAETGEVVRIPDGLQRGKRAYAWALPNTKPRSVVERFRSSEILADMQRIAALRLSRAAQLGSTHTKQLIRFVYTVNV